MSYVDITAERDGCPGMLLIEMIEQFKAIGVKAEIIEGTEDKTVLRVFAPFPQTTLERIAHAVDMDDDGTTSLR